MRETHTKRERGVVLMLLALMSVVLFACLGAASDFGRMFIAKHEAQVFSDTSALAAVGQLDGTQSGALNAVSVVDNSANNWNFGSQPFSGTSASHTVTFSTGLAGPWMSAASLPSPPVNYNFVKVQASLTMPLYFIPVLVNMTSQKVNTMSVAAQTPITSMYEGAFPFTPMSFDPVDPTMGFTKDVQYTIRYPSAVGKPPCAGDNGIHIKDTSSRGYWGDAGSTVIQQRITDDFQSGAVATIGQNIFLSLGAKTTESAYRESPL